MECIFFFLLIPRILTYVRTFRVPGAVVGVGRGGEYTWAGPCATPSLSQLMTKGHTTPSESYEEQQWAGHGRFNVTWPLTLGSVPNGSPPAHLAQRGY